MVLAPDVRRRAALARAAGAAEDTDGEPTTKTAQHVARQLRPAGGGALAASGHDDDVIDRSVVDARRRLQLCLDFRKRIASHPHARAFYGLHVLGKRRWSSRESDPDPTTSLHQSPADQSVSELLLLSLGRI